MLATKKNNAWQESEQGSKASLRQQKKIMHGTNMNKDENKEDTQPVFKRPASKVPKRKAIRCKSKDVSWFDQDLMLTLSRSMSHYQRQIPKDWGRRFRACEFGSGSGRLSRALVDEGIATLAFDIKVGGIHHDITR